MLTYSISSENRRNLIIAVIFQIINQIYIGLEFLYIDSMQAPDPVQQLLINIAYLIAYAFTAKTIYGYLKSMELAKIAKAFFLIAIIDITICVIACILLFAPELEINTGLISLLSLVLWIRFGYLLYQEQGRDLEKSYFRLRQFGHANILIIVPALIQGFVLAIYYPHLGLESTLYLYQIIPQIFLLLFAFETGKHEGKL